MKVSITYSQIKERIIKELKQAQKEVRIAIAWFTDEDIIRELTHLAEKEISVTTVISNVEENFRNIKPWSDYLRSDGILYIFTDTLLL
ncbi:FAM83 family protein [Chitinophaga horti]|uniref:FAM83 family protein n=1 Tax=Chitinophaga horti TaxID=2920382 RepID=A0ABY6J358_9BACT|nr:FAM83 family protein [Chitinophaga horti]UYQ93811.1 FAM83 family protein [Chitinophaga horti]